MVGGQALIKNSILVEHDYDIEKELEKLRGENRKLSRKLAVAQDMIDRNRLTSKTAMALSTLIANEKINQDIFLNLILENSPDIILILDESGRFLYCTESFLKKARIANFGLISGRALSKVFKSFLSPAEAEYMNSVVAKSMLEKNSITLNCAIDFSGEGTHRSFSINFAPMINSNGDAI